jgi:transcriptional regulator with XRE-family HTH domain
MTDAKEITQAELLKKLFGQNLIEFRKKAKMTRGEIAEKLKLSTVTIGAYENGVREPNFEKMIELANLFNVSLDDFFGHKRNLEEDFLEYRYERAQKIILLLGHSVTESESGKIVIIIQDNEFRINKNGVVAPSKISDDPSAILFENKNAFVEFIEYLERTALIENKSFRLIFNEVSEKLFADKAAVEKGNKILAEVKEEKLRQSAMFNNIEHIKD